MERLGKKIGKACRRREINVNKAKSKILRSARDGAVYEMNIVSDGQVIEEVRVFMSLMSAEGRVESKVQQRVFEMNQVLEVDRNKSKSRKMSWRHRKHSTRRS